MMKERQVLLVVPKDPIVPQGNWSGDCSNGRGSIL